MKLLVIITRMYFKKGGDELLVWRCRENDIRENDSFLFIDGYMRANENEESLYFQEQIKNGKIADAIEFILGKIREKLKRKSDYETVGILLHPHFKENSESDDTEFKNWGKFVIKFNEIKKIEYDRSSVEVEFIEKYSSNDSFYKKISELCDIEKVNKDIIEEIWYHYSLREKIKWLNIRKHDLANIFLSLDIDLSGLQKTKFNKNYWNEIKDNHQESAIDLKEVRDFILHKKCDPSVKSIQDDIRKRIEAEEHKNEVKGLWNKIKKEVPSKKSNVWPKNLDINKLKINDSEKAKGQSKEYRDWYSNINESIDTFESKVIEVSDPPSK